MNNKSVKLKARIHVNLIEDGMDYTCNYKENEQICNDIAVFYVLNTVKSNENNYLSCQKHIKETIEIAQKKLNKMIEQDRKFFIMTHELVYTSTKDESLYANKSLVCNSHPKGYECKLPVKWVVKIKDTDNPKLVKFTCIIHFTSVAKKLILDNGGPR